MGQATSRNRPRTLTDLPPDGSSERADLAATAVTMMRSAAVAIKIWLRSFIQNSLLGSNLETYNNIRHCTLNSIIIEVWNTLLRSSRLRPNWLIVHEQRWSYN